MTAKETIQDMLDHKIDVSPLSNALAIMAAEENEDGSKVYTPDQITKANNLLQDETHLEFGSVSNWKKRLLGIFIILTMIVNVGVLLRDINPCGNNWPAPPPCGQ